MDLSGDTMKLLHEEILSGYWHPRHRRPLSSFAIWLEPAVSKVETTACNQQFCGRSYAYLTPIRMCSGMDLLLFHIPGLARIEVVLPEKKNPA